MSDPAKTSQLPQDSPAETESSATDLSSAMRVESPQSSQQDWQRGIESLVSSLAPGKVVQFLVGWFSPSEAQLAEILEAVRSELPTTEALLVGKPQAGKSSIVRGMTGVSAKIVGQGFRPHTRHTERYTYPTGDLPLLIFTDTIGLGDGSQETNEVVRELLDVSQASLTSKARVLILTVKASDFATDTLRQIASQIRQRRPELPCLLAVTSLHEVYPPEATDHPPYPPSYPDLDRAFAEHCQRLQGLYDRAVMLDFTLEEDGYTPVFYGLDALVDALAELLPEAESRAISQLLGNRNAGEQIGNLYREAGRRYMLPFAVMAATLAAVPLPFATMPVLTTLQVSMVVLLGQLYGQTLTLSQAGGLVSAIAGGFLAQVIGRELIKFLPGFGSVIAASWAAAYTWALGEATCVYFGDVMGGKTPDPKRIQAAMRDSFSVAKERFKTIERPIKQQ